MADYLDTEKQYNLSAKRGDKWWTFGSLSVNKFDNWSVGMKVTPELIEQVKANEGKWLNFSVFEQKEKHQAAENQRRESSSNDIGDSIPF